MPKGIDPKAYAARVTKAKKTIASNPETMDKISTMYPKITKEQIANQALTRKDSGVKTTTQTVNKLYRPAQ